MDELLARAIQAYYLARRREGIIADQPSTSDSGTEIRSGKRYVVLRNSGQQVRRPGIDNSQGIEDRLQSTHLGYV